MSGYFLEKIAYRPLRGAPRLVPLISAIGASIFLENAGQLLFGAQRRDYANPDVMARGSGWTIPVGTGSVVLTYTGVLTFVLSVLIMIGLYLLVKRTRLGRAMRAVAENKPVAALMGIDVDARDQPDLYHQRRLGRRGRRDVGHPPLDSSTISWASSQASRPSRQRFWEASATYPGAMLGGLFLGIVEALGPAVLHLNFQLKDVIAFGILVLVLIFRPTGILGEVSSEDKV